MYRQYVDLLHVEPQKVTSVTDIPFLPISFFKTHSVVSANFTPDAVFESSGTSGENTSRHEVKDLALYRKSFLKGFELFYGDIREYCVIGLLPGYFERENSSLVYMVNELIQRSKDNKSGFYLYDHEKLYKTLVHNEICERPTLLIGVTYALLDFADKYEVNLSRTIIMETGGMKGKREELVRKEVHEKLKSRFGVSSIHSEYGMTELLSQAYSSGKGLFQTPPWMTVFVREMNDPFKLSESVEVGNKKNGLVNIIDLANIHSCCFIATDDLGVLHPDGFEIVGRSDASELRGCSLLTL